MTPRLLSRPCERASQPAWHLPGPRAPASMRPLHVEPSFELLRQEVERPGPCARVGAARRWVSTIFSCASCPEPPVVNRRGGRPVDNGGLIFSDFRKFRCIAWIGHFLTNAL